MTGCCPNFDGVFPKLYQISVTDQDVSDGTAAGSYDRLTVRNSFLQLSAGSYVIRVHVRVD